MHKDEEFAETLDYLRRIGYRRHEPSLWCKFRWGSTEQGHAFWSVRAHGGTDEVARTELAFLAAMADSIGWTTPEEWERQQGETGS